MSIGAGLLLLAALAVALVTVLAMPESEGGRPGTLRSLTPRLGVPPQFRPDVYALVPIIVVSWALGGLYLSLGPSVALGLFHIGNHFIGGLVATLLCGTGAIAAYLLRGTSPSLVARLSVSLLPGGTAVTLGGLLAHSLGLTVAGTVIAGIGYGASGAASFGALARIAGPASPVVRGELFAVAYTVAYLAFSVPALPAGYASTKIGLDRTVVAYAILVIVIGMVAALALRRPPAPNRSQVPDPALEDDRLAGRVGRAEVASQRRAG